MSSYENKPTKRQTPGIQILISLIPGSTKEINVGSHQSTSGRQINETGHSARSLKLPNFTCIQLGTNGLHSEFQPTWRRSSRIPGDDLYGDLIGTFVPLCDFGSLKGVPVLQKLSLWLAPGVYSSIGRFSTAWFGIESSTASTASRSFLFRVNPPDETLEVPSSISTLYSAVIQGMHWCR